MDLHAWTRALEALQWEHGGEPLPTLIAAAINALQAELAKPAPTQPAWKDAPNAPGLWVWDRGPLKLQHLIAVGNLQDYLTRKPTSPERWFGPIPEDTK